MKERDFVSEESEYDYKCLACGAQLSQENLGSDWRKHSLDLAEDWSCPKCGKLYQYYYSLNRVVAFFNEDGEIGSIDFTNKDWDEEVEILDAEGIFEKLMKG
jgi:DNA-directed RNA polymerase subunit RPC12/RpoP